MNKIQQELDAIAEANDGILKADAVVEFAKNEDTALHSRFEWDDTKAGHQWRLAQARNIIRINIELIKSSGDDMPVRMFVNLKSDRYNGDGGGYRRTVDVLTDEERRRQLLKEALADANAWRKRYKHIKELDGVFAALDAVEIKALTVAA
jgi:hypothetical protein